MEETPAELWKRYELLEGLYRFYFEKTISFHAFYLPFAGGVVAYVLTHPNRTTAFGLVIPLISSMATAWIFAAAGREATRMRIAIRDNADAINMPATHGRILVRVVWSFLLLHVVLVTVLSVLMTLLLVYGAIPELRLGPGMAA